MAAPKPNLPQTVPLSLWEQMAAAVSPAFADSYLSGAELDGSVLRTKTTIARDRLRMNPAAAQLLKTLDISVEAPSERGAKVWTWPTDEEYAACSLAEKIRHRRIMANECRNRAGPMLDNGQHLRPGWIEKAQNHEAEMVTLRGFLSGDRGPGQSAESARVMVAEALAALRQKVEATRRFRPLHGRADETGLTPEMRELISRQRA